MKTVCERHGKPIDPLSGKPDSPKQRSGYCSICNVGHDTVTMKTAHTPGPWEVQTDQASHGEYMCIVQVLTGRILCRFPNSRVDLENARFIVTACNNHNDLLAALKLTLTKLEQMAERFGDKWPLDLSPIHPEKAARRAIATADGGTR